MMTNAKKLVVLVLLVFMLVASISNVFAYEVTVTKDNLQEAFNDYAKGYEGGYVTQDGTPGAITFGESTPIEVSDSQLSRKINNNTYKIDYSLSGNPTFTISTTFNKDSKLGDVADFEELLESPLISLLGISLVQDMSMGNAYHYFSDIEGDYFPYKDYGFASIVAINDSLTIKLGDQEKQFNQSNFKPSEIINFLFDEEKVMKDAEFGIYTYTVTAKATSEENYELKAVLEINKDADFSKIAPLGEEETNNNTNTNTNTNKANSSKNNTNTNNGASNLLVKNLTNQSNLPKTGTEETIFIAIGFVIVVAFIFVIKLNQYKDVK